PDQFGDEPLAVHVVPMSHVLAVFVECRRTLGCTLPGRAFYVVCAAFDSQRAAHRGVFTGDLQVEAIDRLLLSLVRLDTVTAIYRGGVRGQVPAVLRI